MEINCPESGDYCRVDGASSGTGGAGTVCVTGTLTERFFEDLLLTGPVTVRARVLLGKVVLGNLPPAEPKQQGDVDVPNPPPDWLAQGVAAPGSSATGVQLTAVAYLLDAVSGATLQKRCVPFFGGGANPKTCCPGSGSGSGMITPLAAAISGRAQLAVVVAEGPHAGRFVASASGPGEWRAAIHKTVLRVVLSRDGKHLVLERAQEHRAARHVGLAPFSANFPGDLVDSCRDVVVTLA